MVKLDTSFSGMQVWVWIFIIICTVVIAAVIIIWRIEALNKDTPADIQRCKPNLFKDGGEYNVTIAQYPVNTKQFSFPIKYGIATTTGNFSIDEHNMYFAVPKQQYMDILSLNNNYTISIFNYKIEKICDYNATLSELDSKPDQVALTFQSL